MRDNEPEFFAKIRVERHFKNDCYHFYVYFQRNSFKCLVRQFSTDEYIEGELQEDLRTVVLSKFVKISSLDGETEKEINKITIPKDYKYKVKEIFE